MRFMLAEKSRDQSMSEEMQMKTTPVLSAILGGLLVLAVAQPVSAQNQDESADRVRELE